MGPSSEQAGGAWGASRNSEKAFHKAMLASKRPKPLELQVSSTALHLSSPLEATGEVGSRSASAPGRAMAHPHHLQQHQIPAHQYQLNLAPWAAVAEQS